MEYLIILLVVIVLYLRFTIWKDDEKLEKERDELKAMLDNTYIESPYKIEPIVATKRKTRKRTVKALPKKKLKVVKKRTIKKKVKTKRKTT